MGQETFDRRCKLVDLRRALKISVKTSVVKEDLQWLAEAAEGCGKILELGSFHGRSTLAMLDSSKAHVWCVDCWRYPGKVTEKDYHIFLANTASVKGRITVLKMTTNEAFGRLSKDFFDMIFIDANHSYKTVRDDIINYLPLLKVGGLICGHDYNKNWPGVVKAVNELFKSPRKGGKALWWIRR